MPPPFAILQKSIFGPFLRILNFFGDFSAETPVNGGSGRNAKLKNSAPQDELRNAGDLSQLISLGTGETNTVLPKRCNTPCLLQGRPKSHNIRGTAQSRSADCKRLRTVMQKALKNRSPPNSVPPINRARNRPINIDMVGGTVFWTNRNRLSDQWDPSLGQTRTHSWQTGTRSWDKPAVFC